MMEKRPGELRKTDIIERMIDDETGKSLFFSSLLLLCIGAHIYTYNTYTKLTTLRGWYSTQASILHFNLMSMHHAFIIRIYGD